MKVQGRVNAVWGENWRKRKASCDVNSVMSRSSTTAFAMMKRPTHGVMRYEGDEFIRRLPLQLDPQRLREILAAAAPCHSTDLLAQLGEIHARSPGSLREEAGRRHAGQSIHL